MKHVLALLVAGAVASGIAAYAAAARPAPAVLIEAKAQAS